LELDLVLNGYGALDVTATADQLSDRFVPAKDHSFSDAFTIGRS
jgi:hypothetical protein